MSLLEPKDPIYDRTREQSLKKFLVSINSYILVNYPSDQTLSYHLIGSRSCELVPDEGCSVTGRGSVNECQT